MLRVRTALVLCAALVTDVAIAAPPTLQSVAVTPAVRSLSVGQKQRYTATGTFSDGSTHTLGAAISNMALGTTDTCVLLISGGVDCWGDNDAGQLGDGSTVDSLVARPVRWITTATAVAFGASSGFDGLGHGCAVLVRGAVQCWGQNDSGQLGNGTMTNSSRPVRVTGIGSATAVAAGNSHSCALLASGVVKCWGYNVYGNLGDGTNARWSTIPVKVSGIGSATALALNWAHSCALLASGAVQCWGYNVKGQLGNGTTTNSNVPVAVKGISNATAVATGAFFSCALLASGEVQCWGSSGLGQLGNGSFADSSVPVSVAGISTAVAITAGGFHACAVLSNGSAQCWGSNNYGQLGDGSNTASASNTPVPVSEIQAPVKLVAGSWHTCALLSDGAMRCWGLDTEGQLGDRRRTGNVPTRWSVNVVGTPGVVWESSDSLKATITIRGLATGLAVGNTTITATTAGFINDNAVLTVE
jgi:alpha-tubulin suppressor-like RCC1 family protein